MKIDNLRSPSSRRAWIEISASSFLGGCSNVALLAEGVDRNNLAPGQQSGRAGSPSSRRAWIEIINGLIFGWMGTMVALLAEGVDRNTTVPKWIRNRKTSPSSRRAWIEISHPYTPGSHTLESPSSRRAWIEILILRKKDMSDTGRPPRGGRG